MNVLVSLSSCLVSEGIQGLLLKSGHEAHLAAHRKSIPAGFVPDVVLVDIASITSDLNPRLPASKVLLVDTGVIREDR
jgi:hypothetical protein